MKKTLLLCSLLALPAAARAVDFESDILPIFQSQCFRCHGDGESRGGLSLDKDNIERHIRRTAQIRPGSADRSELVQRLVSEDADERMPRNRPALSEEQIELIKQWIDGGASLTAGAPSEGGDAPAAGMAARPAPRAPEPWTNNEGATIQATLLRVEGENAVLRLANGQEVPYPVANLAPESQAKVREFQNAAPGQ